MVILTEENNQATWDIDLQSAENIARLINAEDKKVALAVAQIIPQIGDAIEATAKRLRQGGRLAYFGSGTSGRIGVLDASEMPSTFGVAEDMVQGFISGGDFALRHAAENAEDNPNCAVQDINNFNPSAKDVVVAISASGNTLYLIKILQTAKTKKALTIAITSNPEAQINDYADIILNPIIGPEVLVGSSRMKSGTAQKMILNMLSTGVMIRLGKTYHNYMIDLQVSNEKLHQRALRFICEICNVENDVAEKALLDAGNVKTACVMLIKKCRKDEAEKMLSDCGGILRRII